MEYGQWLLSGPLWAPQMLGQEGCESCDSESVWIHRLLCTWLFMLQCSNNLAVGCSKIVLLTWPLRPDWSSFCSTASHLFSTSIYHAGHVECPKTDVWVCLLGFVVYLDIAANVRKINSTHNESIYRQNSSASPIIPHCKNSNAMLDRGYVEIVFWCYLWNLANRKTSNIDPIKHITSSTLEFFE